MVRLRRRRVRVRQRRNQQANARANNAARTLQGAFRRRRARRAGARRPNRGPGNGRIAAYANMLADPCNAVLIPGIHGDHEGTLSRTKIQYTFAGHDGPVDPADNSAPTCGYLLWDPNFFSAGNTLDRVSTSSNNTRRLLTGNVFAWASNNADKSPANSKYYQYGCNSRARNLPGGGIDYPGPIGVGTDDSDGFSYNPFQTFMTGLELDRHTAMYAADPAAKFMDNAVARDARLISACMRLTNAGKLGDVSGQIGFVNNIPTAALAGLQYGSYKTKEEWELDTAVMPPPSVNQLFQVINETERLSIQTKEVIHKPTEVSVMETYKVTADAPLLSTVRYHDVNGTTFSAAGWYSSTDVADPQTVSSPEAVTKMSAQELMFPGSCFGFIWRNVDGGTPLIFDLVKAFEWRANPQQGFAAVIPKQIGKSKVEEAQSILDRMGNWYNKTLGQHDLGEQIATISKTGMATAAQKFAVQGMLMGSRYMQGRFTGTALTNRNNNPGVRW